MQKKFFCDKHPIYEMQLHAAAWFDRLGNQVRQQAWHCERHGCTRYFTREDGYLDITPDGERIPELNRVKCDAHKLDELFMIVRKGDDGVYRYTCYVPDCGETKPYTVPPEYANA